MRPRLAAPALALIGALAACSRPETVDRRPPPPPPDGLVAAVVLPHPARTWDAARRLAPQSPPPPTSAALLVATALDLSPAFAALLDLDRPAYGAVARLGAVTEVVVSLATRPGAEVAATLARELPAFARRDDAAARTTLFSPPKQAGGRSPALGAVDGALVLGSTPDALARLGPYVVRVVSRRHDDGADVLATFEPASLAGPSTAWLREAGAAWSASASGGAVDGLALADVRARVERSAELLADLAGARLALTLDAGRLRARLDVDAVEQDGVASRSIASLTTGSARPLLELPSTCSAAVLARDGAEARVESAREQAAIVTRASAGRVAAPDLARIAGLLDAWAHARGPWLLAGLCGAEGASALVVRTPIERASSLALVVEQAPRLVDVPAVAAALGAPPGTLAARAAPAPAGAEHALRIERAPRAPQAPTREVVWSTAGGELLAAAGPDAARAFGLAASAAPATRLGAEAALAASVAALGDDVAFALVFDAALASREPTGSRAWALAALGGHRRHAYVALDLPASLAQDALTRLAR